MGVSLKNDYFPLVLILVYSKVLNSSLLLEKAVVISKRNFRSGVLSFWLVQL